jgi:hypothetical protein
MNQLHLDGLERQLDLVHLVVKLLGNLVNR